MTLNSWFEIRNSICKFWHRGPFNYSVSVHNHKSNHRRHLVVLSCASSLTIARRHMLARGVHTVDTFAYKRSWLFEMVSAPLHGGGGILAWFLLREGAEARRAHPCCCQQPNRPQTLKRRQHTEGRVLLHWRVINPNMPKGTTVGRELTFLF